MKVLVVGATGMLGKPVVRALLDAGHDVSALVRGDPRRLPAQVRAYPGELFDPAAVAAAMAGHDALYLNLSTQPTDREGDRLAEREGLAVLLAAARAAKAARVLALSPLVKAYQGMDGFDWWVSGLELLREPRRRHAPRRGDQRRRQGARPDVVPRRRRLRPPSPSATSPPTTRSRSRSRPRPSASSRPSACSRAPWPLSPRCSTPSTATPRPSPASPPGTTSPARRPG